MEPEWKTRRNRIDKRLKEQGWTIVPFRQGMDLSGFDAHAVTEFDTVSGPADYALVVDGCVVGIIEAKRRDVDPQNVLSQAERYARGLDGTSFNFEGLRVPFLWSSNGAEVFFRDCRHPLDLSRKVADYATPDGIREQLGRDFSAAMAGLRALPNTHPRLRPYQRDANTAVETAMAERRREMLVAMATGTGKTFTTVNQVYRMLRSGTARRILFLVDRRALAAQAVQAFNAFRPDGTTKFTDIYTVYSQRFRRDDLDDEGQTEKFDPQVLPSEYLLRPRPKHTFVYICTVQRMAMNLFGRDVARFANDEAFDDDAEEGLDIPIHAFDVVVADECHRGYTAQELSVWRDTLEHFDAIRIGLTATPAAHTLAYFKETIYEYGYRQAVQDGFLVDYDAVKVQSGVRINGVFLSENEAVKYIDPKTGERRLDRLEAERQFDASSIERQITVPDSNRKVLEEVRKYAEEHERTYGRFPKTLIFAVNDQPFTSHAQSIVELCREVFGRGEDFVAKITGTVDRPLQRIKEFRRIGSTDQKCTDDDLAVFYQSQSHKSFDETVVADGDLNDFDPAAIQEYRRARRDANATAPELAYTDEDLLYSLSCVSRVNGVARPTVAGLILFGKHAAIRRHFPMMRVDYIRVPGREWVKSPEERFDSIDMLGPLMQTIPRAINAVLDDIPKTFKLPANSNRREDVPLIPRTAIREAIVNAVMHRSYRQGQPVQIIRYSNRLEIHNPGVSLVPDDRLGEPGSQQRNPKVAAVLHETRFAETKGSGIRAMREALTQANLSPPTFESDRDKDTFVVTFLFHHFLSPEDIQWLGHFADLELVEDEQRALIYVREVGAINNAAYRDLNRVETLIASGHLRKLRDAGLLEQKGKGAATFYVPTERLLNPADTRPGSPAAKPQPQESTPATSSQSQGFPVLPQGFPTIPASLLAAVQGLGERANTAEVKPVIRQLCAWRPLRAEEVAAILQRGQPYVTRTYLTPMVRDGELEFVYPDQSAHPQQAYRVATASNPQS